MGLFSKKKEAIRPAERAVAESSYNIPEFPMLPEESFPEFPTYEPSISDIKGEVEKGTEAPEFEIPVREKKIEEKKLPSQQINLGTLRSFPEGGRPLFVQIDKYRDVVHVIDAIKAKLEDLDKLINNFESLKEEEDKKIDAWKRDLQNVKEKLVSIDRDLFEV